MKVSSTAWRGGLLAAGLVILGATVRPSLPFGLHIMVARARALPGRPAPIEAVAIDLALHRGRSMVDAVYSVSRDGHMHLDFFKDGRRLYG